MGIWPGDACLRQIAACAEDQCAARMQISPARFLEARSLSFSCRWTETDGAELCGFENSGKAVFFDGSWRHMPAARTAWSPLVSAIAQLACRGSLSTQNLLIERARPRPCIRPKDGGRNRVCDWMTRAASKRKEFERLRYGWRARGCFERI